MLKKLLRTSLTASSVEKTILRTCVSLGPPQDDTKMSEFDRLGTWDNLAPPLLEDSSIRRGTPIPKADSSKVGLCTDLGRRKYQEDRAVVIQPRPEILLFGVFDGHGGAGCSNFCHENIEKYTQRAIENLEKKSNKIDMGVFMKQVLNDLNDGFTRHYRANPSDKPVSSGTTATLAMIRDNYELVVGHVGDSRAILSRKGKCITLTREHCPSNEGERRRIEAAGGKVVQDNIGRHLVNNRLAMSRSLGDIELKPFGVTAQADIVHRSIRHSKDEFLVIVTDGITFVMSDQEIVDCINRCSDVQDAAEKLIEEALLFSCEDNATAVIVPLGRWSQRKTAESSFLSLGRSMMGSSRFS